MTGPSLVVDEVSGYDAALDSPLRRRSHWAAHPSHNGTPTPRPAITREPPEARPSHT